MQRIYFQSATEVVAMNNWTNPTKMNLMLLLSMMTMFSLQQINSVPVGKHITRVRRAVFDIIERGDGTNYGEGKTLRWIKLIRAVNKPIRENKIFKTKGNIGEERLGKN